jgi:hypothetical protein
MCTAALRGRFCFPRPPAPRPLAHGAETAWAGLQTLFTGEVQQTFTPTAYREPMPNRCGLFQCTYLGGSRRRVVYFNYAASAVEAMLSRLGSIAADANGNTRYGQYTYLGYYSKAHTVSWKNENEALFRVVPKYHCYDSDQRNTSGVYSFIANTWIVDGPSPWQSQVERRGGIWKPTNDVADIPAAEWFIEKQNEEAEILTI